MTKEKNHRLNVIRSILNSNEVHSQKELGKRLKNKEIDVSQSTISRDLKELGYIRAPIGDGSYRIIKVECGEEPLNLLFEYGFVELTCVENLVIIKTRPGNAQAVAGALDRARIDGIVGTVAGDDTILTITRNKFTANKVLKKLKDYIK